MTDPEPTTEPTPELSAEDRKLVTLARATRARVGATEGAALRDGDGRTYAAATVDLPSMRLSAVRACVAMAVASGAHGLEAVVVLGESGDVTGADLDAVRDLGGPDVVVHAGDPRGTITATTAT